METSMFFMIAAVLTGYLTIVLFIIQINGAYHRSLAALSVRNLDPSIESLVLLRIEHGVAFLEPFSNVLLHQSSLSKITQKAVKLLQVRVSDLRLTNQSILALYLGVLIAASLLVLILTRSVVAAGAVVACIIAASVVAISSAEEKLRNQFREEVPAVLELMNTCFGSGFTLLQTFHQISEEISGELGKLFSRSVHVIETGGSIADALDVLRKHADTTELTFIVAALEIQHQNGGALASTLAMAAESIKDELALKQALRTQTAQAKLSARIVVVMPFVLLALFSLISPNFLAPFFTSIPGYVLFGIAICMELAGVVLVKRSLSVGGLS